jgi:hypothetical protein
LKSLHSAPWDLKDNGTFDPAFFTSWDPSTGTVNTDQYYDDEPVPALPPRVTVGERAPAQPLPKRVRFGEGAAIQPPPGLTHPYDDLPQAPLPEPDGAVPPTTTS